MCTINVHDIFAMSNEYFCAEQSPWTECNVLDMARDGVHFVRRRSGGGTVFHVCPPMVVVRDSSRSHAVWYFYGCSSPLAPGLHNRLVTVGRREYQSHLHDVKRAIREDAVHSYDSAGMANML